MPNFSVSDQDDGKQSEPATSRQPFSLRRIRIRSSWTSSEAAWSGGIERMSATPSAGWPAIERALAFLAVALREALGRWLEQQVEHLALRRLGAGFRDEDLVGMRGVDAPLLAQLDVECVVDLDPVVEVERLQADR